VSRVSILAQKLSKRQRRLRGSRTHERDDRHPGLKQPRRPGLIVPEGRMANIHELRHRLPRRAGSRAAWCRWRGLGAHFRVLDQRPDRDVTTSGHQHGRPGAVLGVVGERRVPKLVQQRGQAGRSRPGRSAVTTWPSRLAPHRRDTGPAVPDPRSGPVRRAWRLSTSCLPAMVWARSSSRRCCVT
jgi:hypothetical protein